MTFESHSSLGAGPDSEAATASEAAATGSLPVPLGVSPSPKSDAGPGLDTGRWQPAAGWARSESDRPGAAHSRAPAGATGTLAARRPSLTRTVTAARGPGPRPTRRYVFKLLQLEGPRRAARD